MNPQGSKPLAGGGDRQVDTTGKLADYLSTPEGGARHLAPPSCLRNAPPVKAALDSLRSLTGTITPRSGRKQRARIRILECGGRAKRRHRFLKRTCIRKPQRCCGPYVRPHPQRFSTFKPPPLPSHPAQPNNVATSQQSTILIRNYDGPRAHGSKLAKIPNCRPNPLARRSRPPERSGHSRRTFVGERSRGN